MKTIKYLILLLCLSLCYPGIKAQTLFTEIYPHYKIPITYEVLNVKEFSNKYQGSILDYTYTSFDGSSVQVKSYKRGGEIEVFERPAFPGIHMVYKEFYGNGKLKQKGVTLPNQCKIGYWLTYDESGNGWVTDYENGRTPVGYNQVLEYLANLGYYNYNPSQSAHSWSCAFWFSPGSFSWGVRVNRDGHQYKMYTFDCRGQLDVIIQDLIPALNPVPPVEPSYGY
ncbi:MAG: hypothetical protein LBV43_15265 [Prevotella sp.]|jgi:hypothetical protein|nr:hypothetical protein [Prevotella sp.]